MRTELHPEGKTIEAIVIDPSDVILPGDFSILKPVPVISHYTLLNYLHVRTREEVIARELLLNIGDIYATDRIEESGRNLRGFFILSVARIVAVKGSAPDRVKILVVTKDQWSLRLNTEFQFDQARLDTLSMSIAENNLFGRNKTFAIDFALDPGRYTVGATYVDPRIWGSRHFGNVSTDFYLNRATGTYEGVNANLTVGRPLFSLRTKWAWQAQASYVKQVVRYFEGPDLVALKYMNDRIPYIYDNQYGLGSLEGTRSWGLTNKVNLAIGVSEVSTKSSVPANFPTNISAAGRAAFAAILPLSEDSFGPYIRFDAFQAKYITLKNIQTFALTEDYRIGPSVELYARYGLPGTGSHHLTLTGTASTTHYTRDNLFTATTSLTGRVEDGVPGAPFVNEAVSGSVYNVSPKFGPFRFHAKGTFEFHNHDLQATRLTLGSDNGLRGWAPREIQGNDFYLVNAELRSEALNFWSVHIGLVAFYDGGDAPPDLRTFSWHQDAGAGLRILFPQFDREVFRLDLAFPFEMAQGGGYSPRFSAQFGQAF